MIRGLTHGGFCGFCSLSVIRSPQVNAGCKIACTKKKGAGSPDKPAHDTGELIERDRNDLSGNTALAPPLAHSFRLARRGGGPERNPVARSRVRDPTPGPSALCRDAQRRARHGSSKPRIGGGTTDARADAGERNRSEPHR